MFNFIRLEFPINKIFSIGKNSIIRRAVELSKLAELGYENNTILQKFYERCSWDWPLIYEKWINNRLPTESKHIEDKLIFYRKPEPHRSPDPMISPASLPIPIKNLPASHTDIFEIKSIDFTRCLRFLTFEEFVLLESRFKVKEELSRIHHIPG